MTLTDFLLARIAEEEEHARIAQHDCSEHALAEYGAMRRIVDLHAPIEVYDWNPQGYCAECSDSGWAGAVDGARPVYAPCPTLRLLALPYAGHADYRPEWQPDRART